MILLCIFQAFRQNYHYLKDFYCFLQTRWIRVWNFNLKDDDINPNGKLIQKTMNQFYCLKDSFSPHFYPLILIPRFCLDLSVILQIKGGQ
jgi:hypothetical protein